MNFVDKPSVRCTFLIAALAICGPQADAASVFGRALGIDGSSPRGPCRATVHAEVERRVAPEPVSEGMADAKTRFSAPLDRRGYFHIVGVPPGKHMLVVECPTASGVRELRVRAVPETRIPYALALEELTLEIAITPKVDPHGRPWQLAVDATVPRLRRIADKAMISANGRWARRGLATGSYRISVTSSDGTPWLQQFFNLSAASGPLSLRLAFMRVEGIVRLSTRPVRAELVFHNDAGGEPATITTDDNGFFRGLLATAPDVQESTWTVEARVARPPIRRRLAGVSIQSGEAAWLDLGLPTFALHGTVVSQEGRPQIGAQVTFEDSSSGARVTTATDNLGAFELADLPPGNYTGVAESVDGTSDRVAFEVAEGVESELTLVLNPSERIPIYVVSSQGPLSDAAVQVWSQPGVPQSFTHTDPEGRFEVKLPPRAVEVGVTVRAPGYPLKMTRLLVSRQDSDSPHTNTISLDETGGTLVLDLQSLGRVLDSPMTPYLVHKGAIEAVGTLVDWVGHQGDVGSQSNQSPELVETIEPGVYSLCMIGEPAELEALWLGAMPSHSCRTGSVDDGGTLSLSPP